jgi:hypothetical protein
MRWFTLSLLVTFSTSLFANNFTKAILIDPVARDREVFQWSREDIRCSLNESALDLKVGETKSGTKVLAHFRVKVENFAELVKYKNYATDLEVGILDRKEGLIHFVEPNLLNHSIGVDWKSGQATDRCNIYLKRVDNDTIHVWASCDQLVSNGTIRQFEIPKENPIVCPNHKTVWPDSKV